MKLLQTYSATNRLLQKLHTIFIRAVRVNGTFVGLTLCRTYRYADVCRRQVLDYEELITALTDR
uniref:Uncharacterized protein n=1 Tax=Strigamia maritima TaxID=126957 RepID=T1J3C5_STRMM